VSHKVDLAFGEDGWVIAECPELPGCVSQGKNKAGALANIREAMAVWLWAEEQKAAEVRG
jgi:predicted RNase H-like HicB family nuclease